MPRRDVPLIVTAVAYSVAHHLGSVPDGLGQAGIGTRWADWLDLLVPFVVLLPALGTLLQAGASRATYVWFAVGSWLYCTGHGIHLSANSIGNVASSLGQSMSSSVFYEQNAGYRNSLSRGVTRGVGGSSYSAHAAADLAVSGDTGAVPQDLAVALREIGAW